MPETTKTWVLVTGVGGPAGRSLARQLEDAGIGVVGVDMDPAAAERVSETVVFHEVPAADHAGYADILRLLAATYDVPLVIPTVSDELGALAGEDDPLFLVSGRLGVELAADKWLTFCALHQAGVPTPRTVAGPWLSDADVENLGLPYLTKPRVSRGGRGVQVHDQASDDWHHLGAERIAQEFASGAEYCPNLYLAEDPADDVVVVLAKTGLAHGRHGNATGVRAVTNAEVGECARAAARALGLRGPVDVDVRRLADGTPVVLEINARFGANSAYAPEVLEALIAERLAAAQEAPALEVAV